MWVNQMKEIARHKRHAAATFKKDARINIRISSKDLRELQKLALSEGLPYQTLISGVLHKYAERRLTARSSGGDVGSVLTSSAEGQVKRVTGIGGIFFKAEDPGALRAAALTKLFGSVFTDYTHRVRRWL